MPTFALPFLGVVFVLCRNDQYLAEVAQLAEQLTCNQ